MPMHRREQKRFCVLGVPLVLACAAAACAEASPTTIFRPVSTPANGIQSLAVFVLAISAGIFVGVAAIAIYAMVRYRARGTDDREPPQVFGSTQIELAWTIIPILIIVVLFLATARVIFGIQDAPKPKSALDVVVIGHQFWWEYRYPKYNVVTANELHVPVSTESAPRPTFLKLTSADVVHSYWIPRLAGKTDLIPNQVNEMWIDPHETGSYDGQCAQFCGAQHAKMLVHVYVEEPAQFEAWIARQQKTQSTEASGASTSNDAVVGRQVFERQACINCHAVAGTVATGRFGPDLTHLMSRATIAAGIAPNTPENLQNWIADPNVMKPGALMPAMHLTPAENAQITAYLMTLK